MGFDLFFGSIVAEAASTAGIILLLMTVCSLMAFGVSVLSYVLCSLSMYTIAQRRGIRNPWLAWVPVGNLWILGSISDQYQYVTQGKVRSRRKLLLGLQIAMAVMLLAMLVVAVIALVQLAIEGSNFDLTRSGILGLGYLLICVAETVLALLLTVFQYICLYNLFASCEPENKVIYLVLSIFLSVILPFVMFACRKKDLGMPPRRPDPAITDPPVFEG